VEETATGNAYFLPESLNILEIRRRRNCIVGFMTPSSIAHRRICPASFAPRIFGPLKIDLKDVQWKDAFVTIAINDLRGTREAIVLDWGGTKRPMLPGSQVPGYTTGATASLAATS